MLQIALTANKIWKTRVTKKFDHVIVVLKMFYVFDKVLRNFWHDMAWLKKYIRKFESKLDMSVVYEKNQFELSNEV